MILCSPSRTRHRAGGHRGKYLPPNYFLVHKGKNSHFTVRRPGRHYLHQGTKANMTIAGQTHTRVPWYDAQEGTQGTLVGFSPGTWNLSLILRKHQADPTKRQTQLGNWPVRRNNKVKKQKGTLRTVLNQRLRRHESWMQHVTMGWTQDWDRQV